MNKLVVLIGFCIAMHFSNAQELEEDKAVYQFENLIDLTKTDIKDQCRTGTCWSFATVSFLESEILRMGKGIHDLSEMFNVRMTYPKKAEMYLRLHGKHQFGPGSLSHDVINVMGSHGVVPEEVYAGRESAEEDHNHGQLDAVLEAVVKAILENKRGTGDYMTAIHGILDAYLGEAPESFSYNGEEHTPESLRDDLGLDAANYKSFTSYTHHPFYSSFVLEIPDNFSQGEFINVPVNELVKIVDSALEEGYTISWDADVSEKGFSFKNGMAIIPEEGITNDQLWNEIVPEREITQKMRQETFDNFTTTDDHLMHLTGKAVDQNGTTYYMIKNSWGSDNPYGGVQYISESYLRLKTVAILLHKDAVPKELSKKCELD